MRILTQYKNDEYDGQVKSEDDKVIDKWFDSIESDPNGVYFIELTNADTILDTKTTNKDAFL